MRQGLLWLTAAAVVALVVWWLLGDGAPSPDADEVGRPSADAPADAVLEGRGPRDDDAATIADGSETVPSDGFAVSGRVLDASGAGASGIPVVVWLDHESPRYADRRRSQVDWAWRRPDPRRTPAARTTSEAEGRFGFPSLPAGRWMRVEAQPPAPRVGTTARIRLTNHRHDELVLVLGTGTALVGRVVAPDGSGLEADLTLAMKSGVLSRSWSEKFEVHGGFRTDADGGFRFEAVPDGAAEIEVHVPGRIRRRFQVTLPRDEPLELRPFASPGVTLHGAVRDAKGAGIGGARLAALVSGSEGSTGMAETAADGTYRISDLPPGALHNVTAVAEGYRVAVFEGGRRQLEAGALVQIDLTLRRGAILAGHVRDDDGQPITKARVHVRVHETGTTYQLLAETNDAGAYRVEGLPPDTYVGVLVRAAGFFQPEQEGGAIVNPVPAVARAKLAADEEITVFDVVLAPAPLVEGIVVDAEDRPVAGAHVFTKPAGEPSAPYPNVVYFDNELPEQRTGRDGRFVFDALPPGTTWDVAARTETRRSPSTLLDLREGPVPPLRLVLSPAASISGRVVTPDGAPFNQGRVMLDPSRVTTAVGPDGRFHITSLAPGRYDLLARNGQGRAVAEPVTVDVATGQQVEGVVLTTRPASEIGGVLLDAGGTPRADVTIWVLRAANTFPFAQVRTGSEGRFHLRVWEDGVVRFRVGQEFVGDTWPIGRTDLELVCGEAGRVDAITVRIVDPEGAPIPKCTLQVWTGNAGSMSGGTHAVDGGTYVLQAGNLGETTTLSVSAPRGVDGTPLNLQGTTHTDIDTTSEELEIRLEIGRQVHGLVSDAAGDPVEGVWLYPAQADWLREVPRTKTDATGRFTLVGLAPGPLELQVGTEAPWLPQAPIELAAGDDEVRITLQRGVAFAGRVVGPDGAPAAGVKVEVRGEWEGPVWRRSAKTDAEGRFEIGGIPQTSTMRVRVETRRTNVELPGTTIEGVRYGDGTIEIRLEAACWIEGTIVDVEGEPVTRGSVGAAQTSPHRPAARVQLDGKSNRFRLGPLKRGRYRVRVWARGHAESPAVEADAPSAGLVLVAYREAPVEGRIQVEDAKGWSVLWAHPGGGRYANVEEDGRFVVQGAPDVAATLYATGPDAQYAEITNVRAADGPFELVPRPGGRITGRIEGYMAEEGRRRPTAHASRDAIHLGARIEEDGSFVINSVGPGAWTVRLMGATGYLATVEGVEAGTENVHLEVPDEGD